MKKMTARALGMRIRKGVKKLGLRLSHRGYFDGGSNVCAIGGALAFAAKSHDELSAMLGSEPDGGHRYARAAAKILNHKLTPRDMVMLEMGYEARGGSHHLGDKNAESGQWKPVSTVKRNPFYKLGVKLREESLRAPKTA